MNCANVSTSVQSRSGAVEAGETPQRLIAGFYPGKTDGRHHSLPMKEESRKKGRLVEEINPAWPSWRQQRGCGPVAPNVIRWKGLVSDQLLPVVASLCGQVFVVLILQHYL